jgi:hypothetical protein
LLTSQLLMRNQSTIKVNWLNGFCIFGFAAAV